MKDPPLDEGWVWRRREGGGLETRQVVSEDTEPGLDATGWPW